MKFNFLSKNQIHKKSDPYHTKSMWMIFVLVFFIGLSVVIYLGRGVFISVNGDITPSVNTNNTNLVKSKSVNQEKLNMVKYFFGNRATNYTDFQVKVLDVTDPSK